MLANDARSKEALARQAFVVEAETWKVLASAALDWQDIVPIGDHYEAMDPGVSESSLDPAKIAKMALEKQALALESLTEFHSRPARQEAVSSELQQQDTIDITVEDQPSSSESEEVTLDSAVTSLSEATSEATSLEKDARILPSDSVNNSLHAGGARSAVVLATVLVLLCIAVLLICVAPPDERPPDIIAISVLKAVAPWYVGGCLIALFGFLLQRKGL